MSQQSKSFPPLSQAATNATTTRSPRGVSPQAPSTEDPSRCKAAKRAFSEAGQSKGFTGPGQASQERIFDILEFDFTLSPGAEEWQSSQTTDGCAVYSTVDGVEAGVTIEFQKWDW
ncbi:hypothetical protein FS837_011795 [Tulasnella sp. UAMH 9824]|nr:hypothetical protein FS837_011795 [Tulasnella sp. UAMH 9824]